MVTHGHRFDDRRDFSTLQAALEKLDRALWRWSIAATVNQYPIFQVESVPCTQSGPEVLITAGVHGDEPAGVETVFSMLETRAFPQPARYLIWPCLNPYGFMHDQRENDAGTDLNRILPNPAGTAMDIFQRTIAGRRFHICLDLHEDWEAQGFYMYEGKSDTQWHGPGILERVSQTGAIDTETDESDIPLFPGLLQVDPAWGGRGLASFLLAGHADHVMIFETPTAWPLEQRVTALRVATISALEHYRQNKSMVE